MNKSFLIKAFLLLLLMTSAMPLWAGGEDSFLEQEDTMLMFVGERLEVLSIASRRQESAWQAPAVAQVITGDELRERGIKALSQSLETAPGFYMAQKEWGTEPYLRGMPDSVLFLYDTVPLGSDMSKLLHPLNHELSLASVKRIEIIRGPGSVLWGPDAFAGIVNVVPMTGKDLDGSETGVLYGGPGDQKSFYVNIGHDAGLWDAFVSVSGRSGEEDDTRCNLVRFWGDGETAVLPEDRMGEERPGRARYLEASGRLSFKDRITLSGLVSDYKRPYAMSEGDLTWRESRSAPFGFVKLEAKKDLDQSSALRFTGTYSWLNPEYEIIDRTLKQKERTSYGEIIYDRSFSAGRGLFTGGMSYRKKEIEDAPVWDGYLPDYLGEDNENLLPIITHDDYETRLWSMFGQYRHRIGDIDLWLGVRDDEHDDYEDHISYNAGAVWSFSSQWVFKALYGTAYRTPFARQLLEEENPDLEKIKTLSAQIAWNISKGAGLNLCGFVSHIKNHIMEDPYAGLSLPNHQRIKGVEIEGHVSPVEALRLTANLTLLDNGGPDEVYHYNDYTYFLLDGTPVKHYTDLIYPYDRGARRMFNLTATWRPVDRMSLYARLGYFSSRQLIYPRGEDDDQFSSSPGVWLLDMSGTIRDVFVPGLELELSVKNLTNNHYETPGTYTELDGNGFSMEALFRMRW